jgi:hypothetical protein
MPGKSLNVLLRLYGPLEAWFDKTWMPGDLELVELLKKRIPQGAGSNASRLLRKAARTQNGGRCLKISKNG